MAKQPSFTELYRLGARVSKQLEKFCTLEEVAAELGITRQNAYTETVIALGKLVHALHRKGWGSRAMLGE